MKYVFSFCDARSAAEKKRTKEEEKTGEKREKLTKTHQEQKGK